MSSMPGDPVLVTSLVSGRRDGAIKLRCTKCKYDRFIALLIGKGGDLHLQCATCGESHCAHGSQCHAEQPNGG